MTEDEAVAALDALGLPELDTDDEEAAPHIEADEVLRLMVSPDVRAAYDRLRDRLRFWYA